MSVSIGGKIVTDGLVMHYDALNKRSYPGSGTEWFNLTPNSNYSASLDVAATPVTIANGYAAFSAPNDTSTLTESITQINSSTSYVTVDMWVKLQTPPSGETNYLAAFGGYYIAINSANRIGFGSNLLDLWGLNSTQTSDLQLINNWKHYSFIMANGRADGPNLPPEDQKIYVNGSLQTLSRVSGDDYPTTRTYSFLSTSDFRLGRRAGGGDSGIDMDVALVKVYNRELTQAEVTQNFNAHKGRFNIY
jgi:hypothetical protein